MPAPTREAVLDRLDQVVDPCSLSMGGRRSIVSMGLVEDVRLEEEGKVRIELVLTDPSCVFWKGIRENVKDVVGDLPGVDEVEVAISPTATWTPDRLRRAASPRA